MRSAVRTLARVANDRYTIGEGTCSVLAFTRVAHMNKKRIERFAVILPSLSEEKREAEFSRLTEWFEIMRPVNKQVYYYKGFDMTCVACECDIHNEYWRFRDGVFFFFVRRYK